MSAEYIVHIIGLDVRIGSRRRQRCAWCGAVISDEDLAGMAWTLNEDGSDPGPPGMWPVGELIAHDGAVTWVVDHVDGADLPPECCAMISDEITAS